MGVKSKFRKKFDQWLDRRVPPAQSITLHHRQTFVLPTRFGYMMLFILILMIIAATNYQNSMAFLLTFTLSALGFNVIIQTYQNLTGLKINSKKTAPIYAGQHLNVPLIISATDDRSYYSVGFGTKEEVQQLINVRSGENSEIIIKVLPEDRGWYSPGRFYTATVYPMGLLRVWSWFALNQQYLVYPTPVDPSQIEQQNTGKQDQDDGKMGVGNEDFAGIRSYRKGDPLRKIHWRAYAKGQGLNTMEFEEPEGRSSILDFDNFEGFDTELRLSYLCFLVLQAEASGERYGLLVPGTSIEANQGTRHQQLCLKTLALFQANQNRAGTTDL